MEYLQLKTLVDLYNIYFTIYNFDKKHATHLNPTIVLKSIYQDYQNAYSISKGDFKKDNLHEINKKSKMDNSNKRI
jgi:hypothetical protein